MQYDVTQYSAQQNQLSLIGQEMPVVKLLLSQQQAQTLLDRMPDFLAQYEQRLYGKVDKFRSASSVSQQLREAKQRFETIKRDWSSEGHLNFHKAGRLYDGLSFIMEFAMKEIAYKDGLTFLEEAAKKNNQAKDISLFKKQLKGFFMLHFGFTPTVKSINLERDILGINDDATLFAFYVFTSYDVLYNYPKMFKTEDIPCFVLNFAYDLQQTQSLGHTKQDMVAFAFKRVTEGLAIREQPNHLFSFRSEPLFQIELSDYSLPLINGRQRSMVHVLLDQSNQDIEADFIVLTYDELASDELDDFYVPITATTIENRQQLTELVNSLDTNQNYYEVLLQEFLSKFESEEL